LPILSLVTYYKHHVLCENVIIHPIVDVNSSIIVPWLSVNMITTNKSELCDLINKLNLDYTTTWLGLINFECDLISD
jgi:hypothetical protein